MSEKIEKTIVKYLMERDELDDEQRADLATAAKARPSAYAPYSNFFMVGAAIRTKDGEVYSGWNVETIVYNGPHAETGAVCRMTPESRAAGLKRITVVGAPGGDDEFDVPTRPCGSCRQLLVEFLRGEDNPEVISAGIKGKVLITSLLDDLEDPFCPKVLRKGK